MTKEKQAALDYLITKNLLTLEEYTATQTSQLFKVVKSKRKHQLKSLESMATKVLMGLSL